MIYSWGCLVTDPFLEFAKIDVNGGGMITFDEWAHCAQDMASTHRPPVDSAAVS